MAPVGETTSISLASVGCDKRSCTIVADPAGGSAIDPATECLVISPKKPGPYRLRLRDRRSQFDIVVYVKEGPATRSASLPPTSRISPGDSRYTTVSETRIDNTAARHPFNGEVRSELRRVEVSGIDVVLEESGRLYEQIGLNSKGAADILELRIYAKNVTIASPIRLPGTTVSIFVDTISFSDGMSPSLIDTTPMSSNANTPPEHGDGSEGQAAGDIRIIARTAVPPAGDALRLVANGGRGQIGAVAQPGTAEGSLDIPPYRSDADIGGISRGWREIPKQFIGEVPGGWNNWGEPYGLHKGDLPANVVWFRKYGNYSYGDGRWPTDGRSGIAGGKPGNGGKGGRIEVSPSLVAVSFSTRGGSAGGPQGPAQPWRNGTPTWSVGISIEPDVVPEPDRVYFAAPFEERSRVSYPIDCGRLRGHLRAKFCQDLFIFEAHVSNPSKVIDSPGPDSPFGPDGEWLTTAEPWLSAHVVDTILTFADDLYRDGDFDNAIEQYRYIIKSCTESEIEECSAYVARAQSQLEQLTRNLDYYGNASGWIPAFNLSAAVNTVSAEVRLAAEIVAAAELARMDAEKGKANLIALRRVRDAALNDVDQLRRELADFPGRIVALKNEMLGLESRTRLLADLIQQRKAELLKIARENISARTSTLQRSIKMIARIAQVVPVYQPVLSSLGKGLDVLADPDADPLDQLEKLAPVAEAFTKSNLDASLENYKKVASRVSQFGGASAKDAMRDVKDAAAAVAESVAQYRKLDAADRVSQSAIDQEINRLKESDPDLTSQIEEAAAICVARGRIAESLQAMLSAASRNATIVQTLLHQVSEIDVSARSNATIAFHSAITEIGALAATYRARMDLEHYQLEKAYEYYSGRRYARANRVALAAENLRDLISRGLPSSNMKQDDEEALVRRVEHGANALQSMYKEEIEAIRSDIRDRLNTYVPTGSTIRIEISDPADLRRLTEAGSDGLFLPLTDVLPVGGLNARIESVRVDSVKFSSGTVRVQNAHVSVFAAHNGFLAALDGEHWYSSMNTSNRWGAIVNSDAQGLSIAQDAVPASVKDLLSLATGGGTLSTVWASPPALPGLSIKFDGGGEVPPLQYVSLSVEVGFEYPQRAIVIGLRTNVSGHPGFYVSAPGPSSETLGTWIISSGMTVDLAAPDAVGQHRFIGWYRAGKKCAGRADWLGATFRDEQYLLEARYSN